MRTAIEAEKYQFARKGEMLKLVRLRHSKTKFICADVHKIVKTAEKIVNTSSIDRATTRGRVNSKLLVFLVKENLKIRQKVNLPCRIIALHGLVELQLSCKVSLPFV